MKIKFLLISILGLALTNLHISHAATFGTCQLNDPANPNRYNQISINSPQDLLLNTGIGIDATFNPDEIEIYYDITDTSCSSPIRYHAHNGNSTDYSNGEIEYNFSFRKNSLSSFSKVTNRISSSQYYGNRILSSFYIQFYDTYTITVSDTLTSGTDPFDGQTNNAESFIKNSLEIGTDTDVCQSIGTEYDMNGVQYTESNERADDVTQWQEIISYTGYTSDTCPLTVEISTGSQFYGEMDIENEWMTWTINNDDNTIQFIFNSTGNDYWEIPLYRNMADIGDTSLIVMNVRMTLDGFFFYDTDGALIE